VPLLDRRQVLGVWGVDSGDIDALAAEDHALLEGVQAIWSLNFEAVPPDLLASRGEEVW